jgi:hypothetical protein
MKSSNTQEQLEQNIQELEQKRQQLKNAESQYRYLVDSFSDSLYSERLKLFN